jgi:hypothetical protein
MNNNPVRYNDPTGHKACDDEYETGDCKGGTIPRPKSEPKPVNPLGRRLSDPEMEVMAVIMTLELSGIDSDIDWELVRWKVWVFFNLIDTRKSLIRSEAVICKNNDCSNNPQIGTWTPYVAYMGHEGGSPPSMKDILAQDKYAGKLGWDPNNYAKQEAAVEKLASAMGNKDSDKYNPLYEDVLAIVKSVEAAWYQSGSGSPADPTGGAVSFRDWSPNELPDDMTGFKIYGPWDFAPGVTKYTSFR